jgi:hypothetical protein
MRSRSEGYSQTPLAKKLGVKPNSTLALVNAPEGFEQTLVDLPEGVAVTRSSRASRQLTIWFVIRQAELRRGIARMTGFGEKAGLWIAWPKKTSGTATDVTQSEVREVGLAAGLVDFKVCAIDATWTALRFSLRKK